MCLDECKGGPRILEVGFGFGLTFLNLTQEYDEIHGLADRKSTDVSKKIESVRRDVRCQ